MQGLCVVAVFDELVGYLLRFYLRAAEDDGEDVRVEIHDTLQGQILVFGVDEIVDVIHVLGPFVARAHHDFLVVVQIVLGDALHLPAHRGREEQRVVVVGQRLEDGVDTLREAHVEHFVSLVKHDVVHLVELGHPTVDEVDESSRCGHDDLRTVFQRAYLRADVGSAIHGSHMQAVNVFGKRVEVIGYLQAQFARGTQYHGLRGLVRRIGLLHHGQSVGGRFSRTGLCQCDDVVFVTEQVRDYFFLYGHGIFKPQLFNGATNVLAHAQFFKCLQFITFLVSQAQL